MKPEYKIGDHFLVKVNRSENWIKRYDKRIAYICDINQLGGYYKMRLCGNIHPEGSYFSFPKFGIMTTVEYGIEYVELSPAMKVLYGVEE